MPTSQKGPRKGSKFLDVKVFIAALALAVTIGLWNLLSAGNLQATKANPDPVTSPPPQAGGQDTQGFGAIPTLVPLLEVDPSVLSVVQSSPTGGALKANPSAVTLRSVTAPSAAIVQKSKPRVEQQAQVVVVSGGGSSGGGGGGGAAVATTSSSK